MDVPACQGLGWCLLSLHRCTEQIIMREEISKRYHGEKRKKIDREKNLNDIQYPSAQRYQTERHSSIYESGMMCILAGDQLCAAWDTSICHLSVYLIFSDEEGRKTMNQ